MRVRLGRLFQRPRARVLEDRLAGGGAQTLLLAIDGMVCDI